MEKEHKGSNASAENSTNEHFGLGGKAMSPMPLTLQASTGAMTKSTKPKVENIDFRNLAASMREFISAGWPMTQFKELSFINAVNSLGRNGWSITALKTMYKSMYGAELDEDIRKWKITCYEFKPMLEMAFADLGITFNPKDTSKHKPSVIASTESKLDAFFTQYQEIFVLHNGKSVSTKAPYHWNKEKHSRVTNANNNRASNKKVATLLTDLTNEGKINGNTKTGKATPSQLAAILTAAVGKGLVNHSREDMFDFLAKYGLGIDCSGFVSMAYNFMCDGNMNATDDDKFKIGYTVSDSLKGGTGSFTKIAIGDIMAGDTMHLPGHIRIINRVKKVGGVIYFQTIESIGDKNPNNNHDGVHRRWWKHEAGKTFSTWDSPNTATPEKEAMTWKQDDATNTFGRPK